MRRRSDLSCQELVELVTDYLEGTPVAPRPPRFEKHLKACDGCTRYLEQMRLTIAAVGRLQEQHITARAREELLDAFRDWKGG